MTKKFYYGLITVLMFCCGCGPSIPPYPPLAYTTFTIQEPQSFNNCYLRHQQPGAPTTKISVLVSLRTSFSYRQRQETVTDTSATINPNVTPFPVTLTGRVPTDGTPAKYEVIIQGLDCSECANGHGADPNDRYGTCPASVNYNTNPPQYRAARPQWSTGSYIYAYSTSLTVGLFEQIENVPRSCICTVN